MNDRHPPTPTRGALIRWLCVVVASVAAIDCAHYEPRPLSPADSVVSLETRSLADPGLEALLAEQAPASGEAGTWDFDRLLLAAYYFHPDLDVARAELSTATAGRITAGERPDPAATIFPSYDTTNGSPSPWIVTSLLEATIEMAGKRGYRRLEAEQRAAAAGFRVAGVAWRVRTGVRRALVTVENAQAVAETRRRQVALESETLEILQAQLRAGAIAAYELTRARIAARDARLALTEAERQVALARVALAGAIGVPATAIESVTLSYSGLDDLPEDGALAEAREQTLLNHPDLLAALAEYAAADAALRLEIARQYPDLRIGPGFEFDQGDGKWGISLSLPLTFLRRNRGPIAEAEARRVELGERFNAIQARLLTGIDEALASYRAARDRLAEADTLRDELREQERRAAARLDAGDISRLESLGVRLQLNAAELAQTEAAASLRDALVGLEEVLQSPAGLPESLWRRPVRAGDPDPDPASR